MKYETFDRLEKIRKQIEDISDRLEKVEDAEDKAYHNLPEKSLNGAKGDRIENNLRHLDDALDLIGDAACNLDDLCEAIDRDLVLITNPWLFLNVGVTVIHKTFGKGKVLSNNGKYLRVQFTDRADYFCLPDVFDKGFLKLQ